MAKFKEAMDRLFKRVYICRKCKTKIKASPQKVLLGKVKCRRCGSKALRTRRKK